ncbi:YncE family protein [Micromonospora phaseoli]|nr:hypothetical protein [Micromonospora phaseoli]GIJ80043.1 hypothetical protein Xph01_44750 [Micromonospora phaseoli]
MRSRRVVAVLLAAGTGGLIACSGPPDESGPVRVAELPAEVTGLGPAVFLAEVPDDRRSDLRGLYQVERFGADLAGVAPTRRHVEVGVGDPLSPTVARGLAEDPRDAFVHGGQVRDTVLPEHSSVDSVTPVGAGLAVTGSRCLVLRADGQVRQPSVEARCEAASTGGVLWSVNPTGQWGGVDLTTGTPSPGVTVTGTPFGVTPDGRHLFVTQPGTRRVAVVDTSTGTTMPVDLHLARGVPDHGAVGPAGYAYVRTADRKRRLSLVGVDGTVRDLLSPVGHVAFTPDGTRALVAQPSEGYRIVVVDLASGDVRPLTGAERPTGKLTAVLTDEHALVADVTGAEDRSARQVRPVRLFTVDLTAARLTAVPGEFEASTARLTDAVITLEPGGEVLSLDGQGRAVTVGAGARPGPALPDGRLLYWLDDGAGGTRADRLLVRGADGQQTELSTGADSDQVVSHLLPTPDGGHLLVSLQPARGRGAPGPGSEIVLVRLDGTGDPLLLYQGALLVSLGLTS